MALMFSSAVDNIIFALSAIVVVLYFYFSYKYKHWKKRGIPYIEPTLFVGNLGIVFLQRESMVGLFRKLYRESVGHKVVGIFLFHKPVLLIRDLEVVRSVLAKDAYAFLNRFFMPSEKFDRLFSKSLVALKDKKWRYLRIKLTPTFTSGNMKKMFRLVEETSNQLLKHIDQEVSEGRSVIVKDAMSRYTMDAIASCAFGVNANALEDPNNEFTTSMKKLFELSGLEFLCTLIMLFVPWLQKLVNARLVGNVVNDFVRKIFWDVVDYRKAKGIIRKDFVDLLMQLREDGEVRAEDAKDLEEIRQDTKLLNLESSKTDDADIRLEDDDFVAQAYIFMAAGYETSSSVMSFTLFELAMNPAIQDELRLEIEDVLEKHDHKVTYDAIAKMRYLDMVIAESMRKYPSLPSLDRECLSDCIIEGTDITIEKGTVIVVPTYGIHYDPTIFPDPEKFDPERFNVENKSKRSHYAHLPFGEGPRKCIGMRFGLMQVKTGLVHTLKTFQVRPCKDTPELPLEMKRFNGTLTSKKDIILSFMKLK